jgi:hypothetical protein
MCVLFVIPSLSSQVTKVFTKSVSIQSTDRAYLLLPGPVKKEIWKEDYLRITVLVKTDQINDNVLQRLFTVGRYSIDIAENELSAYLNITMPKALHMVTVKGIEMKEVYTFFVQYPDGYELMLKETQIEELGQRAL